MKPNRIVRIDSDGKPNDTVISLEDGSEIQNSVVSIQWELEVGSISKVNMELYGTSLHAEGVVDHVWLKCPICKQSESHECDSG